MGNRALKTHIRQLLETDPFEPALDEIRQIPGRQAVNPLFSFFYSGEARLRWRAISAMGIVAAQLADTAMESARVVMRRLMWNLNDESGGIGWGSPEAIGEITAVHPTLAKEFSRILISYIDPAGNYLEHDRLRLGAIWGVGRLAHARPALALAAAALLPAFFDAPDPDLRGTAIWAAGPVMNRDLRPLVAKGLSDHAVFDLYRQFTLTRPTIAEVARAALSRDQR